MTLYMHTAMMFVPATLGLLFMSWLMYTVLKRKLPERLPVSSYDIEEIFFTKNFHPLKGKILLIRNKTDKIHAKSIRLRLPYALSPIRRILLIYPN